MSMTLKQKVVGLMTATIVAAGAGLAVGVATSSQVMQADGQDMRMGQIEAAAREGGVTVKLMQSAIAATHGAGHHHGEQADDRDGILESA